MCGGGAHAISFVMTPTIQTHCFMWGGQSPVLTSNHTTAPRGGARALDTHRLDTPSGDRRGRGLLVQDAQPVDMSGSFYWTLTVGHILGWPQPLGAPFTGHSAMGMSDKSFNGWLEGSSGARACAWDHSWTAQSITSGPWHCSTNQLGRAICGNVFLLAPGPSVLARQTITATRQLVCLVATTVGRHRGWGAHSISFGFDTHHPDPLLQAMGSTP